ncbi:hypothetical protein [Brevifollis gellanilyticus]|uniref:Neutral/alkaline non-lysosomal ceramidase N-terminal domain-containing protein n=1 Tax=Brevifollis gellanilyticus TaxID=748831 RepID=A0A512M914_9BACT|nr:hypothetical protein [Brevifollis gellanilyticus]GEP43215.1 hypothetical protein BGE01nite_25060 [Brevifollis gellanilyticus]
MKALFITLLCLAGSLHASDLQISTFQVDATPPLGSSLCNGGVKPAQEIVTPLTARGVVLLGAGKPIVLCAIDWVGIANESHDAFRAALAAAADTPVERVSVHTLHQHDAPGSDLATEALLAEHGLAGVFSNPEFDREVMKRLAAAVKPSLAKAQKFTHIGLGSGKVEGVASNRRILGANGRVALMRLSSSKSAEAQTSPEGTIDPLVRLISFWDGDKPVVALTYYATHPQSYYGQGFVNWDFVGGARELREKALPGVACVHFDGAGGNVAAGKYNDGGVDKRPLLAQRLANGMKLAWESQKKKPITAEDVQWAVKPVTLPVRDTLVEADLMAKLKDTTQKQAERIRAARDLNFLQRTRGGHQIPLSCLTLGQAKVLHMPGELFVEYQLAAQQMRPDDFIAMAAYGDYGPGYIGTEIAYGQGGYETGIVSRVGPQVEKVLMDGMRKLLSTAP